jgi:signal transduction histidine kinase
LAGGIAHDFNNLLLGLSGALEKALDELPTDGGVARSLRLALDATQQGRDLVRRVTAFAQREALELARVPLEETVASAVDLLAASVRPAVTVRRRIEPVGEALVDAAQIHRVVLNLGVNAADAIGDAAGTISVALERVEVDAEFAAALGLKRPCAAACLTVRDTGCGMPPEVKERIFDPFFTTKPVGEGTGLGLSVVHGIVTEHGGAVAVESEPGRGSSFTVYLPLAAAGPDRPRHRF